MFAAPIAKTGSKHGSALPPTFSRQPARTWLGNQAALRKFPASPPVQAKLVIGPVNDPLEREADRVAAQVVQAPDAVAGVSRVPAGVQRKCAACEQDQDVARKADGAAVTGQAAAGQAAAGKAAAGQESVAGVLASPGRPLDAQTRAFFEPRLRHDFAGVRVHDDARAGASASAIGALAYAAGTDIVFAPGRYAPKTEPGRLLLAHELTHVVQQSRGAAAPGTLRRQMPAAAPAPGAAPPAAPAAGPAAKRDYRTCVNEKLAERGFMLAISGIVWGACIFAGMVGGVLGTLVGPEGTLTGAGIAVVACISAATGISTVTLGMAFIDCFKE